MRDPRHISDLLPIGYRELFIWEMQRQQQSEADYKSLSDALSGSYLGDVAPSYRRGFEIKHTKYPEFWDLMEYAMNDNLPPLPEDFRINILPFIQLAYQSAKAGLSDEYRLRMWS